MVAAPPPPPAEVTTEGVVTPPEAPPPPPPVKRAATEATPSGKGTEKVPGTLNVLTTVDNRSSVVSDMDEYFFLFLFFCWNSRIFAGNFFLVPVSLNIAKIKGARKCHRYWCHL